MNKTEYIAALTEAKRSAIVDRWTPLANGEYKVPSCSFCNLKDILPKYKNRTCTKCPLHDRRNICCVEWEAWMERESHFEAVRVAALAMLARIEAIDVEVWANHLVEIGVLRDE